MIFPAACRGAAVAPGHHERQVECLAAVEPRVAEGLVPLVQVPPRGIWGVGGAARSTTVDQWIGRPIATNASTTDLVLRYLAAYGPASVKDIQTWSGLTRLGDVVDGLRRGSARCATSAVGADRSDAPLPSEEVSPV
jgi:hypothetical protein